MNTLILGFIGPQEIFIVLLLSFIPIGLVIFLIIILIRYLNRKSKALKNPEQKDVIVENEKESFLSKENIKNYYPVKEGNKITLIPFDEIIDLSTENNFVFLTDKAGKEYLVESTLAELEEKFPDNFIRVHKSTIVNKNLISEVKKMGNGRFDLAMKCEKERTVSCSKSYNERIKEIIDF